MDDNIKDISSGAQSVTSSNGAGANILPAKNIGSFKIQTADEAGKPVETALPDARPDPSSDEARTLIFKLDQEGPQPPPKDQIDLLVKIEQVLHAANVVYPKDDTAAKPRFRLYFVSLFNAARWGLEGLVATDEAKSAVDRIEADLIENAAGRIKNAHLKSLSLLALMFSIPCIGAYLFLRLTGNAAVLAGLKNLQVDPVYLANFMLLWSGCFIGVCLSYGLRTTVFTLTDLTTTDKDYLRPGIRLIFAGTLTVLLCLFAVLGLIDIKIGNYALSGIAVNGTLAFVVGTICGISELALPASIGKKADGLGTSVK